MVKNLNIIKRDGSIVEFNRCKIEDAILKAMKYGSGIYGDKPRCEGSFVVEEFVNRVGCCAVERHHSVR